MRPAPYHVRFVQTGNYNPSGELGYWEVMDLSGTFVCRCWSKHNADIICRLLINNT